MGAGGAGHATPGGAATSGRPIIRVQFLLPWLVLAVIAVRNTDAEARLVLAVITAVRRTRGTVISVVASWCGQCAILPSRVWAVAHCLPWVSARVDRGGRPSRLHGRNAGRLVPVREGSVGAGGAGGRDDDDRDGLAAVRALLHHGTRRVGVGHGLVGGQQRVQPGRRLLLADGLRLDSGRPSGHGGLDLDPIVGRGQAAIGPECVVAALPELPA